ncbi:putative membrane protein [Planktotalea frisia]|uniref:EamA-like transporter family protein n=1 Tax=Planktotalea frisia TaxID=696762 RepID=A0A1L9NZD3_9RHOB|nr:DMT family transporter [Planktotalea frisia]MCO4839684.1 DMT family transporter [Paracoccaceae bacterium]OJI94638.1 EamA-like transporter family protein [Planktotalea frisia]PZX35684.1 putative membrane protein [Planktotalea frisia]
MILLKPSSWPPNYVGSFWMVLAMAAFAVEDALVKASAASLPIGQIMMIFGSGGALMFALVLKSQGKTILCADMLTRIMVLRAAFEACGRLFFVLAVALGALSTATIILQATPVVVVGSAWLVLGERPSVKNCVALFVGAVGVVVVLGPTIDGISWTSLLAFFGMLGFAGRDLTSRVAPKSLSIAHLGFLGFLTVAVVGLAFALWEGRSFQSMGPDDALYLCAAICFGAVAYAGLMKAMRTGDVSAVAPFRYFRLVFGILLGVTVFGEQIGFQTLLGAALIAMSGLLLLGNPLAKRITPETL